MHFKLIYGNHWNFGINVGDTFLLIKSALELAGHIADIEKELCPGHVNVVIENFDAEYVRKIDHLVKNDGRLIIVGTEFLTKNTFNNFSFQDGSSYYFDSEYWSERYNNFLDACQYASAIWHFSDVAKSDYEDNLSIPVLYFPHYYVPNFKQVIHRSDEQKNIDFLFTGAKTEYRTTIINELKERGFYVESVHALTAPFHRNDLISRAKICLNLKQFREWPYPSQSRFFYHLINESLLVSEQTDIRADIQDFTLTASGNFIDYCVEEYEKGNYNERAKALSIGYQSAFSMLTEVQRIIEGSGL
ncbi:hypothetical protein [Marinomonas balearica]|uniref:Glycosyl transferase family 1 n=1 Tax=Marinomonas balearica TaxID=491947 RepID=A0A4R6M4L8_9GAMM|nr:hypothetical protein [Marinomonas balearica]TDO96247.1 hypothetical protein DFP79_2819 [Marinomonas balearica]